MVLTAKKAAEICREWYYAFSYKGKGEEKCVLELLDAADTIEALEALQTKWISVEERLPENCVEVLLYYKKGYLSMGYWDDDLCEWDGMTDEKIVRPDYWMPLPEPPKED